MEGEWTGYSQPLERSLLKKNRYLDGKAAAHPRRPRHAAGAPAKASTPFGEKLLGARAPDSRSPRCAGRPRLATFRRRSNWSV